MFQADDKEFKAELGRIVEMDAWDAAKLVAAEQLRAARHRALQLEQELSVRSAYLAGLDAKVGPLPTNDIQYMYRDTYKYMSDL